MEISEEFEHELYKGVIKPEAFMGIFIDDAAECELANPQKLYDLLESKGRTDIPIIIDDEGKRYRLVEPWDKVSRAYMFSTIPLHKPL